MDKLVFLIVCLVLTTKCAGVPTIMRVFSHWAWQFIEWHNSYTELVLSGCNPNNSFTMKIVLSGEQIESRYGFSSIKKLSWMDYDKLTFLVMETDNGHLVPAILKGTPPNQTINLQENVRFYLYTRSEIAYNTYFQIYVNDTVNLQESGFDVNNETKFIIHGFANTVQGEVVQAIKDEYLNKSWYNVIGVDWSDLCSPPYYNAAVNNIDSVGWYLAQMIDYLIRQNLSIELIHVIGHSLGAHVAGSAGSYITSGILPRITGLDPAKPLFELNELEKRLDPTDAQFVDCIHTCGGYLGFFDPVCSVDFYPNGGTDPQPGCTWDVFGVCSHGRSYSFYSESIKNNVTPFTAIKCETIQDVDNMLCNTNITALMGDSVAFNTSGIYYLKTSYKPPFVTNDSFAEIGFFQKILWFFINN